jgi:hypothetical protein
MTDSPPDQMPILGGGQTPVEWLRSIAAHDDYLHARARAREGRAIADWIEARLATPAPPKAPE